MDHDAPPWVEPPFFCDYGYNIKMGKSFYANFNCCILDCGPVTIGDRVLFGPAVQVYTVSHPLRPEERNGVAGCEFTRPVVIEDDVWVGGAAIILPGVTIGKGSTVAAGAVVTKDVPPRTVVAGNPARVIKSLEAEGEQAKGGDVEVAMQDAGANI
jgi:maltose O-acetyltransferase